MRVVVTGATGCVGRSVLQQLAETTHEVIAASRSAPADAPGTGSVAWVSGDLTTLAEAVRGGRVPPADACIHCAAAVHQRIPDPVLAFEVNVRQTVDLAAAMAEVRVGVRFVQVSTVAVSRPSARMGAYAASKLRAEERLAELPGIDLKVVRLTTTYGPGDRGNVGRLYKAISAGRYFSVAPRDTVKSLLWARSAAAGLLAAATCEDGVPGSTTLADPEPYTLGEVERALAAASGKKAPAMIPAPLVFMAAAAGSGLERWFAGRVPFSRRVLETLSSEEKHRPHPWSPVTAAALAALRGDLAERFAESYKAGARKADLA